MRKTFLSRKIYKEFFRIIVITKSKCLLQKFFQKLKKFNSNKKSEEFAMSFFRKKKLFFSVNALKIHAKKNRILRNVDFYCEK